MAKTYRRDPDDFRPRNPVTLAMIRAAKRTVAHGQTKKAARRAEKVNLQRNLQDFSEET